MALTASILKPILREYEGRIDKNEVRQSRFGMLDQFKSDTTAINGIYTPEDIQKLKTAQVGRDVEIPVINYDPADYSLTAGKPSTLDPAFGARTSALVTPQFDDYWFAINMSYGEHSNNAVKYIDKFVRELFAWDLAVATQLNADAISAVEAARTQIVAQTFGATFDPVNDIVNFTLAESSQFLTKLNRMMSSNDYFTETKSLVANEGASYEADIMAQRSIQNDQNLALQLKDWKIKVTNAIADAVDKKATGYAMADGNTAIVEQIAAQNRAGLSSTNGRTWMTMVLPISGVEVNVLYGSEAWIPPNTVTDYTNNPLDLKETWIFWVRTSVQTAYNSAPATNASPFIKFDISAV